MSGKNTARPVFPKRAVVTAGMPYGSKNLHFGHVGGMFIHADIYARFLRDRLGRDNVLFVSGTDCFGTEPELKFQEAKKNGYEGDISDFVREIHRAQKEVLDAYGISLSHYPASALGRTGEIHAEESKDLFNSWYDHGYLRLDETMQFYDDETQTLLNGRQVEGRCPIAGCKSEKAYADECALGHQFNPNELIAPVSVTTGKEPSLRAVRNWYFDLERFLGALKERQIELKEEGISRRILLTVIDEFLKPPAIFIKIENFDSLNKACAEMPGHTADFDDKNKSATLTFTALRDRERACETLRAYKIRYRTKITLVPFRLSGNIKWGIPVPEKEGLAGQTFWVWPESLWAPVSFVKAYLEQTGSRQGWEDWWFNRDARVYQFIGEDCIYFYAVAGMGLFMAMNEIAGRDGGADLPVVIPNRHAFYGNKKAASSGSLKAPEAMELLDYYTVEQLRMHFAHMALQSNSANFCPKLFMGDKEGFDATLAEGNILTNVYNRLIRSCFYTMQKYFDGKMPDQDVSGEIKTISDDLIFTYEWAMYKFEFPKVIDLMDVYLRDANKMWALKSKEAENADDNNLRGQTLADTFHIVRTAATLLHPFAPGGTEKLREYLGFDERLWDWEYIGKPLRFFMDGNHNFKFLEPRVDFFEKHPRQLYESQ